MMKRFLLKMAFLIFVSGLSLIGQTQASFLDEEESLLNSLQAGTLDFSLASPEEFLPPTLNPGDSSTRSAVLTNEGSLGAPYNLRVVKTGGDDGFCQALSLRLELFGVDIGYSGSLLGFDENFPALMSGGYDNWKFIVSLDSGYSGPAGETCEFNFVFSGWQDNSHGTWGFSDEEVLASTLASESGSAPPPAPAGGVVINEVYYDVAPDKGNEGNDSNPDEWVELYNNTDDPVNLKNWTLSDNSDMRIISHTNVDISAKGFAVLAKSANTWTYWNIPPEAEKISLGQKIGDGLANAGDRLILRDNNGTEVDAVSWGSDTYAFAPSVSGVAEGHSISRVVKGVDTDSAADWMDTHSVSTPPGPNPGTNPHPPVVEQLENESEARGGFVQEDGIVEEKVEKIEGEVEGEKEVVEKDEVGRLEEETIEEAENSDGEPSEEGDGEDEDVDGETQGETPLAEETADTGSGVQDDDGSEETADQGVEESGGENDEETT